MNNIAVQFIKEAYYELRKSSWLTRKEAADSTRAVLMLVVVLALFVAGVDFIVSIVLGSLLGR
jgi:preprotein translocase SecE subunit